MSTLSVFKEKTAKQKTRYAKNTNGERQRGGDEQPNRKTALVISAGGAKGAFAVGVIKNIYRRYRESGWFSIVGGSSTGALITPAAALLGGPSHLAKEALDLLVEGYSTLTTRDILDRNRLVALVGHRNSLNASDPLRRFVNERLTEEWFEWLESEEAPFCYVVYTNFTTGEKVTVSPKHPGVDRKRFMEAMLASASVPVLMEPTVIDGDLCFDGGVRDILPFDEAINLGADRIVPIFLDPERLIESSDSCRNLKSIAERAIMILLDEIARNDYEHVQLTHQAALLRQRLLRAFKRNGKARRIVESICSDEKFSDLFRSPSRSLEIIEGLRPDQSMTTDMLEFDPEKMKSWMKLGEEKASVVISTSPFV